MPEIVISSREIRERYNGDLRKFEAAIVRQTGCTRAQSMLVGKPARPPRPEPKPKAQVAVRAPMPTEEEEQTAFFDRCEILGRADYPNLRWIFAVPNGGQRHKAVAAKLKAAGVKKGVSDVLYLVARGGFHGLAIEFKRQDGGVVSPLQEAFIEWARSQGYRAEVAAGCDEAWRILREYDPDVPAWRFEDREITTAF